MNNTFQIISIITFVLAGLLFVLAIILFFALNVKKSIDILSGHAEKKSIMQMQSSVAVKEKQKVYSYTEKVTESLEEDNYATIVLNENEQATTILSDNIETELLNNSHNGIRIIKEVIYIHTNEVL